VVVVVVFRTALLEWRSLAAFHDHWSP